MGTTFQPGSSLHFYSSQQYQSPLTPIPHTSPIYYSSHNSTSHKSIYKQFSTKPKIYQIYSLPISFKFSPKILILSPSLSTHTHSLFTLPMPLPLSFLILTLIAGADTVFGTSDLPIFREAPAFWNGPNCAVPGTPASTIHIAMTLDKTYIRGSIAAVFSILRHTTCPENIAFHFITAGPHQKTPLLHQTITSTFPYLTISLHHFNPTLVRNKISTSIRRALDQPLNYARIYLADLLPRAVRRVIYFDSDLIVVDDVTNLYNIDLKTHVLGAPEYCHANFTSYFTPKFWNTPELSRTFRNRRREACYFNTGVMVIDLEKWRAGGYTGKLESWMRLQKRHRIYQLGSLPPFLLVFGGEVEQVEHRWNQHGLGGDNIRGLCRDLHAGPVSLLHWSGKGKPWLRIDSNRPCPLDSLWAPYDLLYSPPSNSAAVLLSD